MYSKYRRFDSGHTIGQKESIKKGFEESPEHNIQSSGMYIFSLSAQTVLGRC